ncbi:MAG: hypothetical protein JWM93_3988 [Frankiales bacterium]|nr:hypothetical protein [Frankiales bacterium]
MSARPPLPDEERVHDDLARVIAGVRNDDTRVRDFVVAEAVLDHLRAAGLLGEDAGLRERIEAARALHAPVRLYPEFRFAPWCGECSTGIRTFSDDGAFDHRVLWPCDTAKALGMTDPLAPNGPDPEATS